MPDSVVVNHYDGARGWRAHATPRVIAWLMALLCVSAWFVFMRTPFVVDLPLMHYVAWRVGEGDVPYVDIWDMNGPAAYMIHQVMSAIPLPDATVATFLMTLLTGACVWAVWRMAARGGRAWLGLAAGVVVLAWLLARGSEYLMQRDMIIGACAAIALALVIPGARAWRWGAAGLLIGLAVGVKPTAAPFAVIALTGAAWIDLGEGRKFSRTLWLIGGGAIGGAVWLAWLVATGGLAGFWYTMTSYNADYMKIARVSWDVLAREPSLWIALAAAMGCGMALPARVRAKASREELAMLGMAAAFALWAAAAYVMQGKGWTYQTAPALILAIAAGAAAISTVHDVQTPVRAWAVAAGVIASCVAASAGVRGQLSLEFAERQALRVDIASEMAASLERLPPGMKVQPLDTTDGAVAAMTRTNRVPASPVMYDFWLFEGSPEAIARSRAAVLAAVNSEHPPAVLMTNQGWPTEDTGFARMRGFKEFQAILDARYTLVAEGRRGRYGYRLFAPAE